MLGLSELLGLLTAGGKVADGFKGKWMDEPCDVKTFAARPIGKQKVKLFVKLVVRGAIRTIDGAYDTTSGQPDRDVIKVDGEDVEHEDIKFGYGVKGQLFPPRAILWAKFKFVWDGGSCEVSYQKAV